MSFVKAVQIDGETASDHVADLRLFQRRDDVLQTGRSHGPPSRYMLRRYSPPTSYNA